MYVDVSESMNTIKVPASSPMSESLVPVPSCAIVANRVVGRAAAAPLTS
jgi:hypothetical protein